MLTHITYKPYETQKKLINILHILNERTRLLAWLYKITKIEPDIWFSETDVVLNHTVYTRIAEINPAPETRYKTNAVHMRNILDMLQATKTGATVMERMIQFLDAKLPFAQKQINIQLTSKAFMDEITPSHHTTSPLKFIEKVPFVYENPYTQKKVTYIMFEGVFKDDVDLNSALSIDIDNFLRIRKKNHIINLDIQIACHQMNIGCIESFIQIYTGCTPQTPRYEMSSMLRHVLDMELENLHDIKKPDIAYNDMLKTYANLQTLVSEMTTPADKPFDVQKLTEMLQTSTLYVDIYTHYVEYLKTKYTGELDNQTLRDNMKQYMHSIFTKYPENIATPVIKTIQKEVSSFTKRKSF